MTGVRIEVKHVSFPLSSVTWPEVGDAVARHLADGWRISAQFVAGSGLARIDEKARARPSDAPGFEVDTGLTLYAQFCREVPDVDPGKANVDVFGDGKDAWLMLSYGPKDGEEGVPRQIRFLLTPENSRRLARALMDMAVAIEGGDPSVYPPEPG